MRGAMRIRGEGVRFSAKTEINPLRFSRLSFPVLVAR